MKTLAFLIGLAAAENLCFVTFDAGDEEDTFTFCYWETNEDGIAIQVTDLETCTWKDMDIGNEPECEGRESRNSFEDHIVDPQNPHDVHRNAIITKGPFSGAVYFDPRELRQTSVYDRVCMDFYSKCPAVVLENECFQYSHVCEKSCWDCRDATQAKGVIAPLEVPGTAYPDLTAFTDAERTAWNTHTYDMLMTMQGKTNMAWKMNEAGAKPSNDPQLEHLRTELNMRKWRFNPQRVKGLNPVFHRESHQKTLKNYVRTQHAKHHAYQENIGALLRSQIEESSVARTKLNRAIGVDRVVSAMAPDYVPSPQSLSEKRPGLSASVIEKEKVARRFRGLA